MSAVPLSDSLASLHEVITSECDKMSKMELFVVDGNGKEFPIYTGLMTGFCVEHLYTTLRNTSTFYNFTLMTINASSGNKNAISRREFCWLTPPASPRVVAKKTATSLSLAFDRVMVCGITDYAASERIVGKDSNLEYVLCVCQGASYHKSRASKYAGVISNIEADDLSEVYRGPFRKEVTVEGLRPNFWYYLRLSIHSPGLVSHSAIVSAFTTSSVPDHIGLPCATVVERSKYYELVQCELSPQGFAYSQDRIKLVWSHPHDNGEPITKYQVQLQEVLVEELENDEGGAVVAEAITSAWKTIYFNRLPECALSVPGSDVIEWRVRVRCYNAVGWSDFGQHLLLNAKSHPGLFNSGY